MEDTFARLDKQRSTWPFLMIGTILLAVLGLWILLSSAGVAAIFNQLRLGGTLGLFFFAGIFLPIMLVPFGIIYGFFNWRGEFAKMGVEFIDPGSAESASPDLRRLFETISDLAQRAGLPAVPLVGYLESEDVNAFAYGTSAKDSTIIVYSGLLDHMADEETEAVLAHEIAHIRNRDAVARTMLITIQQAFFTLLIQPADKFRSMVEGVGRALTGSRSILALPGAAILLASIAFSFFLVIANWLFNVFMNALTSWFSRVREYRADASSAILTTPEAMSSALRTLASIEDIPGDARFQASKIRVDPSVAPSAFELWGMAPGLFATHPPIAERIKAIDESRFIP